jgi:hypothetical protein
MKRKKTDSHIGNSTHTFLDDALNDRLSDISALDVKHAKVVERSAHSSPQCRTITSMVELDQHSEFLRKLDTTLMPDAKTVNHSHNDCILKETLMPSNEVLSATECSNVNNNNFIMRETNKNNHLSHGFHTPPMTNNSDLTERKKYRRQSFLRWKNKRCKTNTHFASGDYNTPFTTKDFSEQVGPSNLSSLVVNETTGS